MTEHQAKCRWMSAHNWRLHRTVYRHGPYMHHAFSMTGKLGTVPSNMSLCGIHFIGSPTEMTLSAGREEVTCDDCLELLRDLYDRAPGKV